MLDTLYTVLSFLSTGISIISPFLIGWSISQILDLKQRIEDLEYRDVVDEKETLPEIEH